MGLRAFKNVSNMLSKTHGFLIFHILTCAFNLIQGAVSIKLGDAAAAEALNRLLENVSFQLPDFNVDTNGFHLETKKFICKGFHIDDLDISGTPTKADDLIHAGISGLALECKGDFSAGSENHPSLFGGTVDASIKKSTADANIEFDFDKNTVPVRAISQKCAIGITVSKIRFSGNVAAWIANIFDLPLKLLIQSSMEDLCPKLIEPLINTNLTKALKTVQKLVDPYILPEDHVLTPAPAKAATKKDLFNLTTVSPAIHALHKILDATASNSKLMLDNLVDFIVPQGSLVLEPDVTFRIGDDGLTTTNITIFNISISGVDSLSDLNLLYDVKDRYPNYAAAYSLGLELSIDKIEIGGVGNVSMAPGKFIHHSDGPLTLAATGDLTLEDIHLNVVMQIPIMDDAVENMKIGQLMNHPLFCVMDIIDLQDTEISLLDISFGDVDISTDGFAGLSPLFNDIIDTALSLYEPTIKEVVHGLAETTLRDKMNDAFAKLQPLQRLCLPYSLAASDAEIASYIVTNNADVDSAIMNFKHSFEHEDNKTKYVNFTESSFWHLVDFTIDDMIGIKSPISFNIDQLIDQFVNLGYWNKSNIIDTELDVNVDGLDKVTLKVNEVSLSGLDEFDQFDLFEPESAYILRSDINIAKLQIKVDLYFDVEGSGVNSGDGAKQHLLLKIQIEDLGIHTMSEVLIPQIALDNTTLEEFADCPLSYFESFQFDNFTFSMGHIAIDLTCVKDVCSDEFRELGEVWRVHSEDLNRAVQEGLDYMFGDKGVFKGGLNELLNGAVGKTCDQNDDDSESNLIETIVVISLVAICGVLTMLGIWYVRGCYSRQKYGSKMRGASYVSFSHQQSQLMMPQSDDEGNPKFWRHDSMLMYSPLVGAKLRWFVVLFLLSNHAVFFIANFSLGASIGAEIKLGGDDYKLLGLFGFSLTNSVEDFWNAKAYGLSIVIALLSGIWPHLKIIMMFICWCFPFPKYDRGLCLLWLDALGKWSLVDMKVLVLCMAAFSLKIIPGAVDYLPPGFFTFYLRCTPMLAIFAFLIGTVQSLVATHIILHYHRKELDRELLGQNASNLRKEGKEALWKHSFLCWFGGEQGKGVRMTKFGIFVIIFSLIGSGILIIWGSTLDSFLFHFQGAAGYFVEPYETYSLLSVASHVLSENNYEAAPWAIYVLFLLYSFIIPIVALVLLLVLFTVPLTLRFQRKLMVIVEMCFAWATTEVFLFSVIAAMLQINQFAQFMVDDIFPKGINKLLPLILPADSDPSIINISTSFARGCYVLWAAMIVWIIVMQAVVRLAERSLRDRRGLTERIWATKEEETYYSDIRADIRADSRGKDSVGFRCLTSFRLIRVDKIHRVSIASALSKKMQNDAYVV